MTIACKWVLMAALLCAGFSPTEIFCAEFDMKPHWNGRIALENPDKGWYHHYPDNHIDKYIIKQDAHLLHFPGMDHIYIRLAWAYLEPEEGQFNWDIIDGIISKWVEKGFGIAFRITCKEPTTDRIEQQFATPKWVMEAGAKGGHYYRREKVGTDGPWEPVYDDPIFLEKLDKFLQAFAARYDGKPWLRYVDIGSFGDWGEGHTGLGSGTRYDMAQLKIHLDLYRKHFRSTQLIISDGFVYTNMKTPDDRDELHRYILKQGISYRDDSILVDRLLSHYSEMSTVRSPEFFADSFATMPTVLELQHYHIIKKDGNWLGTPDSSIRKYAPGKTGPDLFRGALGLLRATYIGYHGDAHDWLTENPQLTEELLNRCGYWFFLHQVQIPNPLQAGKTHTIRMDWENRGVAPAYQPYTLKIRFAGPVNRDFELDAKNQNWMPASLKGVYREDYFLTLSAAMPAGDYNVKIKLYSEARNRDVFLALDPEILDEENYYRIGTVTVAR